MGFLGLTGFGGGATSLVNKTSAAGGMTFYMWGAGGGDRYPMTEAPQTGGGGGYLEGTVENVGPTDTLYVTVGSPGLSGTQDPLYPGFTPQVLHGGPNGGQYSGGGGGCVFVTHQSPYPTIPGTPKIIAVAGGGGGNGWAGGGGGGGPTGGGDGSPYLTGNGGEGGTNASGGEGGPAGTSGGSAGSDGGLLVGGAGGPGPNTNGGSGGGGFYGGGGGSGHSTHSGGSGGGGASYGNPAYMTTVVNNNQGPNEGPLAPSPTDAQPFVNPDWHNRGATYPNSQPRGEGGRTPWPGLCSYGGRARMVIGWGGGEKRTFNYSGEEENIPATAPTAGLNFTIGFQSPGCDGYQQGWGWGGQSSGAFVASRANSSPIDMVFTFSGPNSDFTNLELWAANGNGLSNVTGVFGPGGSPFTFPCPTSNTSNGGNPSGDIAPNAEPGNITSLTLTAGGGSGNSHFYLYRMKINGKVVDMGQNFM